MSRNVFYGVALTVFSLAVIGCGKADDKGTAKTTGVNKVVDSKYVLKEEPKDAQDVKSALEKAADKDTIAVVGRIGGSEKPWIDGMAAFTIVDTSLEPCPADEGCETPWDYCCDVGALKTATTLVKVVDTDGKTVPTDARELLGVKELSTVVVHGRAQKDESGNLTVLADGIYVRN